MPDAAKRPKAKPFLGSTDAFRSGMDSPRAVLDRCFAAIDAHESGVKAFVTLDRAGAIAAADASTKRWREGRPLSDIDGIVIGVKDVIETASMPTQMGSPLYAGWRSMRDSASVRALKEAGCVIIGKTVTTEFAASEPGPTCNPWDLSRTPGGSSSGSAAGTAAGFINAGLGTQVVGSILRPASYCGVVGFKPTVGAINRGGSHDHMSQSAQGVIAATMADAWSVLRAIADRTGGDPGHPGLYGPATMPEAARPRGLVVLETPGWAEATDAAKSAFEAACKRLADAGIMLRTRRSEPLVEAAEQAVAKSMLLTRKINAWESRWPLNTYCDRDRSKLSTAMVERATEAEAMTLTQYRGYLAERDGVRQAYVSLAGVCDAVITLSAAGEAPVGLRSTGSATFVVVGSLLGVPAVSLPVLGVAGLPLGLQVLGFKDKDGELMAAAAGIEANTTTTASVRA